MALTIKQLCMGIPSLRFHEELFDYLNGAKHSTIVHGNAISAFS